MSRAVGNNPRKDGMDHREVGEYWDDNADAWTELSRAGYDVYFEQTAGRVDEWLVGASRQQERGPS